MAQDQTSSFSRTLQMSLFGLRGPGSIPVSDPSQIWSLQFQLPKIWRSEVLFFFYSSSSKRLEYHIITFNFFGSYYFLLDLNINGNKVQLFLWGQFLLQGQGLDLWNLRHFCCPTFNQTSGTLTPLAHAL